MEAGCFITSEESVTSYVSCVGFCCSAVPTDVDQLRPGLDDADQLRPGLDDVTLFR